MSSPQSLVAGSAQALSSCTAGSGGIGLLCFFYGIREPIEILVHPSFCLSPSHMVLSSVSYFSFFLKFLFLRNKIGHLNKVLFQWVKRFLRARNHSKESLSTLPMEKPRDFSNHFLPNFLVLWLDVSWFSIVWCWIHFAILLFSVLELPLPWTSTHYQIKEFF